MFYSSLSACFLKELLFAEIGELLMTEGLLNPRFSGTNFENIFSVCPI